MHNFVHAWGQDRLETDRQRECSLLYKIICIDLAFTSLTYRNLGSI